MLRADDVERLLLLFGHVADGALPLLLVDLWADLVELGHETGGATGGARRKH